MQHYSSQVFTDIAKPAGGATIAVKLAGTNTNATIYSDDGITVKSNPFAANNLGQFDFYAASGKYDITISGTQITTVTLPNQVVFDPFEASTGDTILVATGMVPLNSAGVGGFWPPYISLPSNNSSLASYTANQVQTVQFVLPFSVVVGKISINVQSNAAGTADVVIYSIAGISLLNTGGLSTAISGVVSAAVGPAVNLVARHYYFPWCASRHQVSF